MDINNYPVTDLAGLKELVRDAAHMPRPRPTLVLSPPGSGKTETAAALAAEMGLTFVPFELGLSVPEEVGGVPVRDAQTGAVVRFPLGPIRIACERPSLLLIDEVTRADATRQGAAMTGVNERRWGDYHLHAQTVVMLAGNEPDSGGVFSLLDALLNRCCVVRLRTTRAETQSYLRAYGPDGSEARKLATLWADYADGRPEMIAEEPPRGFSESGALWPSGRAICHAIDRMAARSGRGQPTDDAVSLTHVSGTVGREIGVLWHRLNELAGKLPTVAEIDADPDNARVPPDVESAIAALGFLNQLKPGAFWRYVIRWHADHAEIQAAAAKKGQGKLPPPADKAALAAFNKLAARIHRAIR